MSELIKWEDVKSRTRNKLLLRPFGECFIVLENGTYFKKKNVQAIEKLY